ncbi:MFS transporter [Catenuloplanes japonicus]|uniref:MFS transporter n=1 Tax=Catenuloplanes japonicus TaxID=33876 RepID=UPI0005252762|nr:MFS transporter [Catenuloplanes japonicus]
MYQRRTRAWFGLSIVLGPVLLVAMDGSVLFLAMPRITAALDPAPGQALWILDVYGFVVGALLIAFGRVGDRYGRLRLLMIGVLVFGAGSAAAAFAPSAELLIASRALMGLGGATLLPSALAVISELFADPRQRARAVGIFAATFAAGFAIGPMAGGQLLSTFWWGSVFLINLPVVLLFTACAPVLLREVRAGGTGRVDLPSVILSAGGLLLCVYAVKHLAAYGPSLPALVAGPAGLVVLVGFVRRQRTLDHPLVDVALFRRRVFTVAIATGLLSLVAWSAGAYLSAVYLQSVRGLSVAHAALLTLPGAVVLTVTCITTPHLVERVGERASLILCHLSMAAGLLLLAPTAASGGTAWYVASTVVAGVGYGISFSLVAETAVGAVPEERAGSAGAIAETSNEIGNALGIALLGSLATLVFRLRDPGTSGTLDEALSAPGLSSIAIDQAKHAYLDGFHVVAITAAVLCLALAVLATRWIPENSRSNA